MALFAVFALSLTGVAHAQAQARTPAGGAPKNGVVADDPVRKLFLEVALVMTKLDAELGFNEAEWAAMVGDARVYSSAKTHKPILTSRGRPLAYYVIDPPDEHCKPDVRQTVLFLGGVHTDEVAPLYSSFHALLELLLNPSRRPGNTRIVYVPLLNPDGLIGPVHAGRMPTRENGAGIDLNRDLETKKPQVETRFVKELIALYKPSHIVTLHGPYGWLDYDGPAKRKQAKPAVRAHVEKWLGNVSSAGRERLPVKSDFDIYPGSMGKYGGYVLGEHVLTMEFPTKDATKGADDWYKFGDALLEALNPPLPDAPKE